MPRREFSRTIKVAVIRRAGVTGMILCEKCGGFAKRFQIDHIIADAHGGEPVIENAQLLCEDCYAIKNPQDTTIAAKLKRQEAKHLNIRKTGAIRSPGFPVPPEKNRSITKVARGPSGLARQIREDA